MVGSGKYRQYNSIPATVIKAMQQDRDAGKMVEEIAMKAPITKDELAAMRVSLHPGEMRELIVTYYDAEKMIQRKVKEYCVVEHVSRHVVVFRKPNGRQESRTLVELCQLKRMERGC